MLDRRERSRLMGRRGLVERLEGRIFLSSTVVFSDDFEGTKLSYPWLNRVLPGGNADAKWGLNRAKAASGVQSAFCSMLPGSAPTRDIYANNQQNVLFRDNVSLKGYRSAELEFKYFLNAESGYDYFSVNVVDAAGVKTTLLRDSGDDTAAGWQTKSIDLTNFAGRSSLDIEFRFESDNSVMGEPPSGVWIDDVSLSADTTAPPSAIEGTVYNDVDGDRAHSVDEAGLAGWTVFLDQNRNGRRDVDEPSQSTDAKGHYRFDDLAAGVYYVGEELQAGYEQTAPGSGGSTPGTGFHIDVNFPDSTLTPSQRAAFAAAANRWSQIIIGDLPDVNDNGLLIDDLRIDATAPKIDGSGGILGQAAPTAFRSGSDLPFRGFMEFDSADLASLEAGGQLSQVIVHEMGHVLGFGTIWTDKGLLSGSSGNDPRFTGARATAEYDAAFASHVSSVPVENSGGPGTEDSHWRESAMNNELMTGFLDSGFNPLSRITVGSMEDLGYKVNYGAADAFPTASTRKTIASAALTSVVSGHNSYLVQAGKTISLAKANAAINVPVPFEHTVPVGVGETRLGVDFGNRKVNRPPTIVSLSDSPDPVAIGDKVHFTAAGADDPDGSVVQVSFYRESNGTPGLQTGSGGDTLVALDVSPLDGFSADVSTKGLAAGTYTYYAQATDDGGATGTAVSTTNTAKAASSTTAIRGTIYHDLDGDGARDADEPGLSGWVVFLDVNGNGGLDRAEPSTKTDAAGAYAFTGLAAGNYLVREVVPKGFQRTSPKQGSILATVTAGAEVNGRDFGNFRYASIAGKRFNDLNGNGVRDSGEAGFTGLVVYLDRNNNGKLDAGERTTLTDADGNYTFDLLGPGTYVVRAVPQAGRRLSAPASGFHRIVVRSGQKSQDKNFAEALNA